MERKKEESKHQTDFSCSEGNRSGQTSVKSLRWKFPKCECLLKITDETKRKACVKAKITSSVLNSLKRSDEFQEFSC